MRHASNTKGPWNASVALDDSVQVEHGRYGIRTADSAVTVPSAAASRQGLSSPSLSPRPGIGVERSGLYGGGLVRGLLRGQ